MELVLQIDSIQAPFCNEPASATFYTTTQFVLYLNNGCGDSSLVEVEVNSVGNIYIPNAFSPNGDAVNDKFTVYASYVLTFKGDFTLIL